MSRNWNFVLFFNHTGDEEGKAQAIERRKESSIYLREVFDRVARFSSFAKEDSVTSLRLRGYLSMKNQCTKMYIKKILGKYSYCRPAPFGDLVNLIQCFIVDSHTILTGKPNTTGDDMRFVMRVIQDGEKWEEQRKGKRDSNNG